MLPERVAGPVLAPSFAEAPLGQASVSCLARLQSPHALLETSADGPARRDARGRECWEEEAPTGGTPPTLKSGAGARRVLRPFGGGRTRGVWASPGGLGSGGRGGRTRARR